MARSLVSRLKSNVNNVVNMDEDERAFHADLLNAYYDKKGEDITQLITTIAALHCLTDLFYQPFTRYLKPENISIL